MKWNSSFSFFNEYSSSLSFFPKWKMIWIFRCFGIINFIQSLMAVDEEWFVRENIFPISWYCSLTLDNAVIVEEQYRRKNSEKFFVKYLVNRRQCWLSVDFNPWGSAGMESEVDKISSFVVFLLLCNKLESLINCSLTFACLACWLSLLGRLVMIPELFFAGEHPINSFLHSSWCYIIGSGLNILKRIFKSLITHSASRIGHRCGGRVGESEKRTKRDDDNTEKSICNKT